MKLRLLLILALCVQLSMAQNYIHDVNSQKRQSELKSDRAMNLFRDVSMVVGSVFFYAVTDGQLNISYNDDIRIKKIWLENGSKDTLYLNMMCDMKWDEDEYCDFMDVRIPPGKKVKMLVPRHTRYNVHFRTTAEATDNEMMVELNTDRKKHLLLNKDLISTLSNWTQP